MNPNLPANLSSIATAAQAVTGTVVTISDNRKTRRIIKEGELAVIQGQVNDEIAQRRIDANHRQAMKTLSNLHETDVTATQYSLDGSDTFRALCRDVLIGEGMKDKNVMNEFNYRASKR